MARGEAPSLGAGHRQLLCHEHRHIGQHQPIGGVRYPPPRASRAQWYEQPHASSLSDPRRAAGERRTSLLRCGLGRPGQEVSQLLGRLVAGPVAHPQLDDVVASQQRTRIDDDGLGPTVEDAVNGGPGAVGKWKRTFSGDPDEFVENIPYPETRNYVKKVFSSYWNYQKLYGGR